MIVVTSPLMAAHSFKPMVWCQCPMYAQEDSQPRDQYLSEARQCEFACIARQ